ncbi:hypothetical protein AAF712_007361 [Marasmius tenuissimus]|uniref:Major facilitator superfamily (MFS) profile domain-containing protein n=1 Tax=Marasmius tenuissimus TaxID=585030 RepID=A0ABR2ZXR2_9AGAR
MSEEHPASETRLKNELNTNAGGGYKTLAHLPGAQKGALLVILCLSQFLDTYANSALFASIPPIAVDLNITNSDSVWLIAGYQLTFASLLLICGRISDLYNPKILFLLGGAAMCGFSLGAGFVREQIPLIVLRCLMGVGAALTVPSALYIIIHMFPDPATQSKAVAAFAASGAIGNVIGLLLGAMIVTISSWPWVFYSFAIIAAITFVGAAVLTPSPRREHVSAIEKARRFKRLDLFGVLLFTAGLILFIFGVTTGSVNGWNTARCLAPLIISVFLIAAFFFWEARLPEDMAAILPLGLLGFLVTAVANVMQQKLPLKWVILAGQVIGIIGTVLLPFADSPDHYWPFAFPGFALGTSGMTIIFATVNIAVFAVTPPEKAGVVGSIFNCFLQLGCAAGTAIVTSIQTSVDDTYGGPTAWEGRAAGLWFLFALLIVDTICILVFMKNTVAPTRQTGGATMVDKEMLVSSSDSAKTT